MSITIYYEAKRKSPASQSEITVVQSIAEKYSVDSEIEEYIKTRIGRNWESFDYRFNSEPSRLFKKGIIFSGSTKLPDNSDNASWQGIQHWCTCLGEIRSVLGNAEWKVNVEDHEIKWNTVQNAFDLS